MSWGERFTDRMVRRYPALLAIATEYAGNYDGEFEPMVNARESIARFGQLEAPQARIVLNCLRSDTDLESMSLKIEAESIMTEDQKLRQIEKKRGQAEKVEPPPPKRKHTIDIPVKIKVPYAMPKQTNGALHVVSWATREGVLPWEDSWAERQRPPHERGTRVWKLIVHYKCGKYTSDPILVADLQAALDSDERRHRCRMGCFDLG